MRALLHYVAAALLVLGIFAYGPGQEPPAIKVAAPTPESITTQFQAEQKQALYDQAEEVAARVMHKNGCGDEYAEAIAHSAIDNGVSARVLASLAFVESTCRADAVSKTIHADGTVQFGGSVGLTQVNPKAHPEYTIQQLMNPYMNAQIGGAILARYVHKHGLREGLHHYNGMGDPTDTYSIKVLTAAGFKV